MARAENKVELENNSNTNFIKLMDLLDSLTQKQIEKTLPFDDSTGKEAHWSRDKNVKDVLIHLYEWHQLLINWVIKNQSGQETQFLKEGYNWRTYGDMNQEFVMEHDTTSFKEAHILLTTSHKEVMRLLDEFNDEQLFSKDIYPWVGGSTLGSYFVSATASHYEWAYKKLNKFKKETA